MSVSLMPGDLKAIDSFQMAYSSMAIRVIKPINGAPEGPLTKSAQLMVVRRLHCLRHLDRILTLAGKVLLPVFRVPGLKAFHGDSRLTGVAAVSLVVRLWLKYLAAAGTFTGSGCAGVVVFHAMLPKFPPNSLNFAAICSLVIPE